MVEKSVRGQRTADSRIEVVSPGFAACVAEVMGKTPVLWRRAVGGYSCARRFVVEFSDGTSAFVKAGASEDTANWLRKERAFYEALQQHSGGAGFLAEYYGAGEDETKMPFLLLEDLSGAYWPAPWRPGDVDSVLSALENVRTWRGPLLDELESAEFETERNGWRDIAADPAPFLALGFRSAAWLENALPVLIAASDAAPFIGDDLLHLDIRSDNLCIRNEGRAVIVDWNWAARGDGIADIAGWLPSLHSEGGPAPEEILPNKGEFAAWLAGYFASRAGLPPPDGAPRVRAVQKTQMATALPWAARALGLPLP